MVVAPLLVLLYDRAFVAGDFKNALQMRRGLYLGLAATWVWLGLLIATGPDYRAMAMGFEIEIGARDYALAQPEIIIGYLQRVIWPHPLIVDYGQVPPASAGRLIVSLTVILVLAAASVGALIYRKRLGFLGAWFFLLLAPTSSIVPISSEVGAERRVYLPLIALIVLLAIGLFAGLQRWVSRLRAPSTLLAPHTVTVLIVLLLALPLAALTIRRNRDYRSVESIWRTVVEARPGWRAHNNLGAELLHQQRTDEALHHLHRATELGQYLPETWSNLGSVLQQLGRTEEALDAHREALKLDPERSETHNNLAISYGTLGRLDEALRHFREALRLDPANATAHYNLAILLHASGKRGEAVWHYSEVLRLDPTMSDALTAMIRALVEEGRSAEARAYLEEVLLRQPGHRRVRELLESVKQLQ